MNRRQRRAQPDTHPRTGKRLKDLDAVELHQTLVSDAVTGYETPLGWFVAACRRIAKLDRITDEEAYQRVRQEVASLGAPMPGAPGL